VESRPGEGSRFWLELDLPPDPGAGSASLRRGELDGLRAIVVFGEPIEARAATRWAEALGLRVESVRGSDAALLRLREAAATGDPFRVAFGVSPVDDARALASRVREEPALAAIPVVGCIAPGNPGEPAFDVTLTRPLRPSELLRAVSALHLPHREAEVVRDALPDRDAIARPNGFTARVLVAEDNPVNRKLAARLLAKLGCQVELAGDGLEALEAVTAGRFQLIFLDVQMPRMDGHQAARELQRLFARGAHPRVPVVAMTANALPGDREACLAAGMDDYLAKPLRARELEAMLAHWLEA
jgi:CheY-like chemotaxis protein